MEKFHMTAISAVITLALGTGVVAESMSQDDYKAARDRIETTFRADKRRCDSMSGNAKDICHAEAAGREKIAKAELEARHNPTRELRYEARMIKAASEYETARERCDDRTGNTKQICLDQAAAARAEAETNARSEFRLPGTANGGEDFAGISREAYGEDAAAATGDAAEYESAKRRCMDLEGPARKRCLDNAKAQHGR
jgi:hypothetical protein